MRLIKTFTFYAIFSAFWVLLVLFLAIIFNSENRSKFEWTEFGSAFLIVYPFVLGLCIFTALITHNNTKSGQITSTLSPDYHVSNGNRELATKKILASLAEK